MTLYCNPGWQDTLQSRQFATFDQIWNFPVDWIDAPNQNRGGWSGVSRVEVAIDNKLFTLYVKKQQNHTSRSLLHPIKGESTFAKEFRYLRHLQTHGISVPNVIFFAQRHALEGQQAILVSENLAGYQPLDAIKKEAMSLLAQRKLLSSVAKTVRAMHQSGLQHRALYAKHLFVKQHGEAFDVAVIDLEKARRMIFPLLQSVSDLITLNYRTREWNKASRLYFLKSYLGQDRVNVKSKFLCKWIGLKSLQKLQLWNQRHE